MEIIINTDPFLGIWESILEFGAQDPMTMATQLFFHGGWVVLLLLMLIELYHMWLNGRRGQYAGKWKQLVLAIDIPKNNEQTPKAVENIFMVLAGAQSNPNLIEKYWIGKIQESFSFEVVSIEGYIQFIVRTPSHFRDLVEAAIYAQYPEAEITEVEDYTKEAEEIKFPNDKYNLWGTEFLLVKDYPFPIRTYSEFEHGLTQTFLDPMAALLENMSRFSPGEQLWLQLVITPQPAGWGETAKKVIKEIQGDIYAAPVSITAKIIQVPINLITAAVNLVTSMIATASETKTEEKKDDMRMLKLTPGERLVFENIQKKLAKQAFQVKFRMIYLGEKEIFSKTKGVASIIGAIQQFNVADANGFKPGKKSKTGADYFDIKKRVAKKQNRILRHYIDRDNYEGDDTSNMFLNTEELASLWHFPVMTVKAPSVEMIGSKKAIPPSRLPLSMRQSPSAKPVQVPRVSASALTSPRHQVEPLLPPEVPDAMVKRSMPIPASGEGVKVKGAPPSNLPTI